MREKMKRMLTLGLVLVMILGLVQGKEIFVFAETEVGTDAQEEVDTDGETSEVETDAQEEVDTDGETSEVETDAQEEVDTDGETLEVEKETESLPAEETKIENISETSEETENESKRNVVEILEYIPQEQPKGVYVKTYVAENVFPEGTVLIVRQLEAENKETKKAYADAEAALESSAVEYTDFISYDIAFYHDGVEIEPEENMVRVQIIFEHDVFPDNVDMDSIAVQHLAERENEIIVETVADVNMETDGSVENMETENAVVIDFEVDSFSTFTVTFDTNSTTGLKDYYGNAITLDKYNAMLSNVANTIESRTTNGNRINLPITNWKRSTTPAEVTRPQKAEEGAEATEIIWQWDDVKGIQTDLTNIYDVWDGSRLIQNGTLYQTNHHFTNYLPTNVITADVRTSGSEKLYDSATWKYLHSSSGNYSMYRFTGTFDITGTNPYEYAYTVKPVTLDADGDTLYMNDDLYVFVYPVGTTLTNTNFMQHLAFWSGTSTNTLSRTDANSNLIDDIKFNGRSATRALKAGSAAELNGFWKLTDGWNMPAVTDNAGSVILGTYSPEQTEYVMDVFVSDYSAGGGMYRLVVEAEPIQKVAVNLKKIDNETKKGLEGATFVLEGFGGNGLYYPGTTDKDGLVSIFVVPGTYTLKEIAAPSGYVQTTKTWTVVVGEDGNYTITDNDTNETITYEKGTTAYYSVSNTAEIKQLIISKIVTGNMGDVNKNFEFTFSLKNRKDEPFEGIISGTIDENGTTVSMINGEGTFSLRHNQTITLDIPYGYSYVVVEKDYTLENGGYEDPEIKVNGGDAENASGDLNNDTSVTFINHKEAVPDTGIDLKSAPYISVLILMIFGIAMVVFSRRKWIG